MKTFQELFGTNTPIIGALHLLPQKGFEGFTDDKTILETALADVKALENGCVDAIIVENNYDLPHTIRVSKEIVLRMTRIVTEIKKKTKLPLGISVLWNDYEAALTIAKAAGATFIRIPVFVDDVRTSFGDIKGEPEKVRAHQKKVGADNIALYTDIHVKHATLLSKMTLLESARKALAEGASALIITGKWTGDAPELTKLKELREQLGTKAQLLIGSGATKENIKELLRYSNGCIVSTSLKTGKNSSREEQRNIKSYNERIDEEKVREFVREAKNRH